MSSQSTPALVKIWDIWLRLFHWTLAVTVIFLLLSGEFGWFFFEGHKLAGEIVVLLIIFRCVWGVIGSSNARLGALIAHPKYAITHLRDLFKGSVEQESGHSASGAWAVIIILTSVGFQAVSGLFIADQDELLEGVFYGVLSDDISSQLMSLHYQNARLIQIVLIVHVLMIGFYWLRGKINLLYPMITGYIKWSSEKPLPSIRLQQSWVGGALLVVLFLSLSWLFRWW